METNNRFICKTYRMKKVLSVTSEFKIKNLVDCSIFELRIIFKRNKILLVMQYHPKTKFFNIGDTTDFINNINISTNENICNHYFPSISNLLFF